MTPNELLKRVLLIDIIKGMSLTLKMMCRRAVTRQFPEEKIEPIAGFRGRHAFVRDLKSGKEKCIMCMKCSAVCPSQCITIEKKKREEDGRQYLAQFDIEALRCIYCGYCVEVCPVCALVLTEDFSGSAYTRKDIFYTRERLLANWDEFAALQKNDTYFNKFWRPEGLDTAKMPKAKREQAPIQLRPAEPALTPEVVAATSPAEKETA